MYESIKAIIHHHHHQVPDLEQTLATMPLQTSLSSDNFKKFKPLLCPPVAELQRLSRNVIRCKAIITDYYLNSILRRNENIFISGKNEIKLPNNIYGLVIW